MANKIEIEVDDVVNCKYMWLFDYPSPFENTSIHYDNVKKKYIIEING